MSLRIEGLTRSFGERTVLKNLCLEIADSTIRCILGPNGSGKSTLLGLIDGQLAADAGQIWVANRLVTDAPHHRRRWLGIARSFQVPRLMSSLTVAEHIALSRLPDESPSRWALQPSLAAQRSSVLWEKLGLAKLLAARTGELGHSHRKLLDIALAVESRPSVLLLDEPTAGLDHESLQLVLEAIIECSQSATVLVVEHNLDFVRELKCPVSFLHAGSILLTADLDGIRENPIATEVYLHA